MTTLPREHPFAGFEANGYSVIAADPPWGWATWSKKNQDRSAENHYSVMDLDAIKALPVADLAAPNSVLLLWAINSMTPAALEVMETWGFTFKTVAFCWAKTTKVTKGPVPRFHAGLGYYSRQNTESVFLGSRGKPLKRAARDVRQLIVEPRREHSRKPESFYTSVERLFGDVPRVELFSRESRPGWATFGNETGKFDPTLKMESVA